MIDKFDDHINRHIISFLKKEINWKHKFDTEVIPKLNKGWKYVAKDEYGICMNCYHYGNGIDMNCAESLGRRYNNHELNTLMSYEDYKKMSIGPRNKVFEHAIDFERNRIVRSYSHKANFSYAIVYRIFPHIE